MKKEVLLVTFALFLVSLVSAEIIINQQPAEVYNLGDRMTVPLTITTSTGIYDFLQVSLICDGQEQKLPKEEVDLPPYETIKIDKSILLIKKFIGSLKGTCKIKTYFEDKPQEFIFSNEFKISKAITVGVNTEKVEFEPRENIIVEGTATKENGLPVNGFAELNILLGNSSTNPYTETVKNGFFSFNVSMPKESKAGQYLFKITAYEKDPLGDISNTGFFDYNILIKQVPTSLEIVFEDQEIQPGESLKVRAILHDQTGEKINSIAVITIKDSKNTIFEQKEIPTDEVIEFSTKYNQPPSEWRVVALSNKMTKEDSFKIIPKEDAKVEIINKTVVVTNIGNVFYNKTLLVKIGEQTTNINAELEIDETKKYLLSAPNGNYLVDILSDGESKVSENILLTGGVIDVKEISGLSVISRYPLAWMFLVFVSGIVIFMFFRKSTKSFFGHIPRIVEGRNEIKTPKETVPEEFSIKDRVNKRLELALTLSREKQNAVLICLKTKNFGMLSRLDESTKKTFQDVINLGEENNTLIYENQDSIFLIFSPAITRTFKNERKAVEISEQIREILDKHNRLFKQKIDFGISINQGEIITKKEGKVMKFMTLGNLIPSSKKLASISNKEVCLSEDIGRKIISNAKLDKHREEDVDYYTVKELKQKKEEHKKFISSFVKRLEKKDRRE